MYSWNWGKPKLFDACLKLLICQVLVSIIDSLELAAVNGNVGIGKQAQLPSEQNELSTNFADRRPIVLAKIRNRFKVRHQTARQPHEFNITLRFALQAAT